MSVISYPLHTADCQHINRQIIINEQFDRSEVKINHSAADSLIQLVRDVTENLNPKNSAHAFHLCSLLL